MHKDAFICTCIVLKAHGHEVLRNVVKLECTVIAGQLELHVQIAPCHTVHFET